MSWIPGRLSLIDSINITLSPYVAKPPGMAGSVSNVWRGLAGIWRKLFCWIIKMLVGSMLEIIVFIYPLGRGTKMIPSWQKYALFWP